MAIINIGRVINRHKRLFILTTTGTIFVFYLANIFSFFFPYAPDDEFSSAHIDRLKREVGRPDPVNEKDYLTDDLFSEAVMGRFTRRILNESMSFTEVNGTKVPVPLKQLNKAYTEAKKMYFAKKNCVPRPPPTTKPADVAGGPPSVSGEPPAAGGEPPAAGGEPPAAGGEPPAAGGEPPAAGGEPPAAGGDAAIPAADAPAPDPAATKRRRRGAIEATTERVYYCDEFTTTTVAPPPTTTVEPGAAAAPPPADGAAAPNDAAPAEAATEAPTEAAATEAPAENPPP